MNNDGELDLREVIVGLALLGDRDKEDLRDGKEHRNFLLLAFDLLDMGSTGEIQKADLAGVLRMVWPDLSSDRITNILEDLAPQEGGIINKDAFMAWAARPESMNAIKEAFALITPLA